MDMEFGPDGALYTLEYGDGFFSEAPGGAARADRLRAPRRATRRSSQVSATPTSATAPPLTVQFSSAGTHDPTATGSPTRGTSTPTARSTRRAPNPTFTYTDARHLRGHAARDDSTGRSASNSVRIIIGNQAPVVNLTVDVRPTPPFNFGDTRELHRHGHRRPAGRLRAGQRGLHPRPRRSTGTRRPRPPAARARSPSRSTRRTPAREHRRGLRGDLHGRSPAAARRRSRAPARWSSGRRRSVPSRCPRGRRRERGAPGGVVTAQPLGGEHACRSADGAPASWRWWRPSSSALGLGGTVAAGAPKAGHKASHGHKASPRAQGRHHPKVDGRIADNEISIQLWNFAAYVGFGTDAATQARARGGPATAERDRLPERRAVHLQRPDRRAVQGAAGQVPPEGAVAPRQRGDHAPSPRRSRTRRRCARSTWAPAASRRRASSRRTRRPTPTATRTRWRPRS